jgi:hypothetical protein
MDGAAVTDALFRARTTADGNALRMAKPAGFNPFRRHLPAAIA